MSLIYALMLEEHPKAAGHLMTTEAVTCCQKQDML